MATKSITTIRKRVIVAGYVLYAISFLLPAVETQSALVVGVVCWSYSIITAFALVADPQGLTTNDDMIIALTGLANVWLIYSWLPVLFLYRIHWLNITWGVMGYFAFAATLLSPLVMLIKEVHIGYVCWSLSFLLIASGLISELVHQDHKGVESDIPCD